MVKPSPATTSAQSVSVPIGVGAFLYDTLLPATSQWAMSFLNTNEDDTLVVTSGEVTLATVYFTSYLP